RFATANLALLRAHLESEGALPAGVRPLDDAIRDAERALTEPLGAAVSGAEQFTFLGSGWTCGLALEAALKMREAAGAWTEAYPAMEYRHGPISITGPGRIAWVFGELPEGLADDIDRVGGTLVADSATPTGLDPLADLVRAQRLAVACAEARGYDPDRPRHLTRSVVLQDGHVCGTRAGTVHGRLSPRGRGAAHAPRPRPSVSPPASRARGVAAVPSPRPPLRLLRRRPPAPDHLPPPRHRAPPRRGQGRQRPPRPRRACRSPSTSTTRSPRTWCTRPCDSASPPSCSTPPRSPTSRT